MNILFYITLGFLPYLLQSAAENDITATGGGVVEIGKELVLKYNINTVKLAENWSCKWLRYVPTGNNDQTKKEWCIFSLQTDGGIQKLECSPSNFMETNRIEYTGSNKNECKIKVSNVGMDDSVTWAVNLLSEPVSKKINVTVAIPLDSVSQISDPESIDANEEGVVSCRAVGGQPLPELIVIDGGTADSKKLKVNNQIEQSEKMANGKYITVFNRTIVPKIEDHGRKIYCAAIQYDRSERKNVLFRSTQGTTGLFHANNLTLNVNYPPQPIDHKEIFHVVKGETGQISFTINANPKPTSIKWNMKNNNDLTIGPSVETVPSLDETNDAEIDIDFPSNDDKSRYTLYDLAKVGESSTWYVAKLDIAHVTNSSNFKNYYLTVTNQMGSENYYFNLNVTNAIPISTTTTGRFRPQTTIVKTLKVSTIPGHNEVLTDIIIILVLVMVIIGGLIFYKECYQKRQRVPYHNMP